MEFLVPRFVLTKKPVVDEPEPVSQPPGHTWPALSAFMRSVAASCARTGELGGHDRDATVHEARNIGIVRSITKTFGALCSTSRQLTWSQGSQAKCQTLAGQSLESPCVCVFFPLKSQPEVLLCPWRPERKESVQGGTLCPAVPSVKLPSFWDNLSCFDFHGFEGFFFLAFLS